jgi:hypothetical protein
LLVRRFTLVPARSALFLRITAAAALTFGYIDLARGGITFGPALLLIGYLLLVPAMVITWP